MTATFHDLEGASVFVTGGGSGIGAAVVQGFLAQGARVAYADLQPSDGTALGIACDVTDTDALHGAIDQAAEAHGGLDVVVNMAANDLREVAAEVTPASWDAMMDVNLKHYFFACQRAAHWMKDGGSIINYSSLTYMVGSGDMPTYTTANAGIMGMTRALAREWGTKGIRVNAIAPGWVLTDKQMDKWATPEALAAFMDKQCIKAHLTPDDLVGTTLFLASDTSRMMTSQVLVVDAGVRMTG